MESRKYLSVNTFEVFIVLDFKKIVLTFPKALTKETLAEELSQRTRCPWIDTSNGVKDKAFTDKSFQSVKFLTRKTCTYDHASLLDEVETSFSAFSARGRHFACFKRAFLRVYTRGRQKIRAPTTFRVRLFGYKNRTLRVAFLHATLTFSTLTISFYQSEQ